MTVGVPEKKMRMMLVEGTLQIQSISSRMGISVNSFCVTLVYRLMLGSAGGRMSSD